MKKIIVVFCSLLLIVSVVHLKYFLTKGFSFKRIIYSASYQVENETSKPLSKELLDILDGEFTYLSKGNQVYVFESSDKNYVIKFMRFNRCKIPFWGQIVRYLGVDIKSMRQSLSDKENRYSRAIKSYKIACEDLSEYTQVKYIHLNQTDFLNKSICVRDKASIKHRAELDKLAFVIQKKVIPLTEIVSPTFPERGVCIEKMIDSFIDSIVFLAKNNFASRDIPNMVRNCGYLEGKFIFTDVGSFYRVTEDEKDYLRDQLYSFASLMRDFLKSKAPEYLLFYEKRLQEKFSSCSLF